MNLLVVGCSHRTAPVAVREKLAIPDARIGPALADLLARFGGEALLLSTCNRLEVYIAPETPIEPAAIGAAVADWHGLPLDAISPHLYERRDGDAVRHCFALPRAWTA